MKIKWSCLFMSENQFEYEMKIIVGDFAEETIKGTPSDVFKNAIRLSKEKEFEIHTNNPQLIEALELLCGEENIEIFLTQNNKMKRISFIEAYNYLGDIYDIINYMRFTKDLDGEISYSIIDEEIKEYDDKWRI